MRSYKIHLIRTGATGASKLKRYVGQSDLPLCEKGRADLLELEQRYLYPGVETVYTSPLTRCVQTAQLLYPGQTPLLVPELTDMNLGDFEGRTFEELQGRADFSDWLADSFTHSPPGGEDTGSFTQRVIVGLGRVLRDMMNSGCHTAAVVTHGGVIMTLLAAVGLPQRPLHQWAVQNGTGYTLLMNAQMWMQSGVAEVFGLVPGETLQDDMELYGESDVLD